MGLNLKYGAEALALLGIAYGLIKWLGRTIRAVGGDRRREQASLSALASTVPGTAADLLVHQGIISAEDLAAMTPRERAFVAAAAGPLARARPTRATPAHLRLVTPSRLPLGAAVHCPGCGSALDRDMLQRLGHTSCARCRRAVSAHIQRGRVTVIVEDPSVTEDAATGSGRLPGSADGP